VYIYIYITTHGEHCISITKINRRMVCVEIQAVYSKIYVQYNRTGYGSHQPPTNQYQQ